MKFTNLLVHNDKSINSTDDLLFVNPELIDTKRENILFCKISLKSIVELLY